MRSLLCTLALTASAFAATSDIHHIPPQCDGGWFQIGQSCYWFGEQRRSFHDAAFDCQNNRQAKPFVANSLKEFDAVFNASPRDTYIWSGLQKDHEGIKWWDSDNTIAYQKLDWLNKPYDDITNGWTIYTQCAAHFSSSAELGKFTYYFPCNLPFNYICERNLNPEPVV